MSARSRDACAALIARFAPFTSPARSAASEPLPSAVRTFLSFSLVASVFARSGKRSATTISLISFTRTRWLAATEPVAPAPMMTTRMLSLPRGPGTAGFHLKASALRGGRLLKASEEGPERRDPDRVERRRHEEGQVHADREQVASD